MFWRKAEPSQGEEETAHSELAVSHQWLVASRRKTEKEAYREVRAIDEAPFLLPLVARRWANGTDRDMGWVKRVARAQHARDQVQQLAHGGSQRHHLK